MNTATRTRLIAVLLGAMCVHGAQARGPESILERLHPPLVAAHRGGEFGIPNSLAQFASAIEAGDADIIEMDLRLTADGQVVVFHDETLDQRSNCIGTVESKLYIDLLQCKLNDGERIPLFEDVLELVAGRKMISAEPKSDSVTVPVAQLVLNEHAQDWVYLQTGGSEYRYRLVRSTSPHLAVMAKIDSPYSKRWILASKDPYLRIVEMDRDYVNQDLVDDVHRGGKLATMNSWRYQFTEERFVASCDRVFGQGVDIAVTNNARSCRSQLSAWSSRTLDPGQPLDRQHVRLWMARHHQDLTTALLPSLLLPAALSLIYLVSQRRQDKRAVPGRSERSLAS